MHSFIIAAVASNGVIGNKGNLIWHLPADQTFFFDKIKDAILLTGRTSFESAHGSITFQDLSRVIILSSRTNYEAGASKIASNLEEAFAFAKAMKKKNLAVLGGAKVYEAAMPLVDQLVITEIKKEFEGDTYFPKIDPELWKEVERKEFRKDFENPYDYAFVIYERKKEK